MELEIYLNRKDWLWETLKEEIFEDECNDMVFGNVCLEDDTVRFVRFDGKAFERTIEEEDTNCDWQDSEDVAEELVTENLTDFFKKIRNKIKVEDTLYYTDAKHYDVSKHISVGFLDLYLEKRKGDWWYELKDYDTGVTRQISQYVFESFDKEEGFVMKVPTTDEELIDGSFEDILQLAFF